MGGNEQTDCCVHDKGLGLLFPCPPAACPIMGKNSRLPPTPSWPKLLATSASAWHLRSAMNKCVSACACVRVHECVHRLQDVFPLRHHVPMDLHPGRVGRQLL